MANYNAIEAYCSSAHSGADNLGGAQSLVRMRSFVPNILMDELQCMEIVDIGLCQIGYFLLMQEDWYIETDITGYRLRIADYELNDFTVIDVGDYGDLYVEDDDDNVIAWVRVRRVKTGLSYGSIKFRPAIVWNNAISHNDITDDTKQYQCLWLRARQDVDITDIMCFAGTSMQGNVKAAVGLKSNATVVIPDSITIPPTFAPEDFRYDFSVVSGELSEGEAIPVWIETQKDIDGVECFGIVVVYQVDSGTETHYLVLCGARHTPDDDLALYKLYEGGNTDTVGGDVVVSGAALPLEYITADAESKRYRLTKTNAYGMESLNVYLDASVLPPNDVESVVFTATKAAGGYVDLAWDYLRDPGASLPDYFAITATDGITTKTKTVYYDASKTSFSSGVGPFAWGRIVTVTLVVVDVGGKESDGVEKTVRCDYEADISTYRMHGMPSQNSAVIARFGNFAPIDYGNGVVLRSEPGVARIVAPIQISEVAQLQAIGNDPNYPLSGHYVLVDDIDLDSVSFDPIGQSESDYFTGVFDGNGHKIFELEINSPLTNYVGLFGVVGPTACVKNIDLEEMNITGKQSVGALAGIMVGTAYNCRLMNPAGTDVSVITGEESVGGLIGNAAALTRNPIIQACVCDSYNFVRNTPGVTAGHIGGIVGHGYRAQIIGCKSEGQVTGGNVGTSIGGIAGSITKEGKIQYCLSYADVQGGDSVGGICGLNAGQILNCKQDSNYFGPTYGDITCAINDAGGIAGYSEGAIINCAAIPKINGAGTNFGGIVGTNIGTVTNAYYDSDYSGLSDTGKGTPKTTVQMKLQATFTGFDFSTIWEMSSVGTQEAGYPKIKYIAPVPSQETSLGILGGAISVYLNDREYYLALGLFVKDDDYTMSAATTTNPIESEDRKIYLCAGGNRVCEIDLDALTIKAEAFDLTTDDVGGIICPIHLPAYQTQDRSYFQVIDLRDNQMRTWIIADGQTGTLYLPIPEL